MAKGHDEPDELVAEGHVELNELVAAKGLDELDELVVAKSQVAADGHIAAEGQDAAKGQVAAKGQDTAGSLIVAKDHDAANATKNNDTNQAFVVNKTGDIYEAKNNELDKAEANEVDEIVAAILDDAANKTIVANEADDSDDEAYEVLDNHLASFKGGCLSPCSLMIRFICGVENNNQPVLFEK